MKIRQWTQEELNKHKDKTLEDYYSAYVFYKRTKAHNGFIIEDGKVTGVELC